jgi:DNA-binding winged helix-turn-helix (wHTH) protein/tetratricopeptide (TPR) repeat protein/TolB-like protein
MDRPVLSSAIYRFGVFEADAARNALTRNGMRVKIQDQPFRVLTLLLEHPGEIVTREELRQKLWPEGTFVDFDGSLNVILKRLRAAIDDDSDNPRFVETVPRRGYRFIAPVTVIDSNPEAAAPSNVGVPTLSSSVEIRVPPPSATAGRRPRRLIYISGILLAGVAVGITWFTLRPKTRTADTAAKAAITQSPLLMRKSVAVLGFRNISSEGNDAWLGTAFSEMLSTELAGGEKLRLVSGEDVANLRRTSPWSQTDTLDQETAARIGTALNGDLLVLGSYTTIGSPEHGQLRLDVRLQDARTGEILTEIAEIGGRQDLFRVVSRAGAKLRDRIGVPRLEETDEETLLASLPANSEAARFYSLGLVKLRAYDYMAARDFFEQATQADPKFPLAYSMLSRADILLGHDDQAKAEAKRGLDLAGNLPRVQKMEIEASYYHAIADRAKAAEIYRVLFNLFPDSLDYGLQLAKLQLESYQPDAALETVRQLRRLPSPASDDPGLDLREAAIVIRNDAQGADRLVRSAAAKAQAQGKKLIYARAQANLCFTNRQHLQAPPECQEAYETFLAAGNRDDAGGCLQLMAEAQRQTGHAQEAIPLYEQALRMLREAGDREKVGVALNNLALILENQGQFARAEQAFRDAKQNFQAVNDKANTATAISNIADILALRGRLHEAADFYRQSWELADASRRARPEGGHIQYAALLVMQGKIQEARLEVEAQIKSLRAYGGDPWALASALTVLGDIEKAQGNFEGARKSYQEALEFLKKANASVAGTEVSLAELSIVEGHPELAETPIRQAIAEFEKEQSAGDEIGGYTSLSRALLAEGKLTDAQDAIAHAFKLSDLREFPALALPLQLLHAQGTAGTAKSGTAGRAGFNTASAELSSVIQKSQQFGLYNINCEARLALGKLQMEVSPALGRSQLTALASDGRSHGLELLARQAEEATAVGTRVTTSQGPK